MLYSHLQNYILEDNYTFNGDLDWSAVEQLDEYTDMF